MSSLVDPLRRSWQSFNERERRLISLLGATLVGLLVFGVFYLSQSAASDVEEENDKISAVLEDIGKARARLRERASERQASEARYRNRAPRLGGFVEAQAHDQNLSLREVTDQPEEVSGRYTKRAVRVQLPGVDIAPVIRMLAAIDNSPYPVAVERVTIEHFTSGHDGTGGDTKYNVQIGVVAYDRAGGAAGRPPRPQPNGVAGPPAP
jgi:hypothetical protein